MAKPRKKKLIVGGCGVCAVLFALFARLAQLLLTKLSDEHCADWYRDTSWSWYAGHLAIEAGTAPERQLSGVRPQGFGELWRFVAAVFFGMVHAPAACDLGLGSLMASLEGPESRFCRSLLDMRLMSPKYEVTAERETADAFMLACRLELEALGDDERALVEPLRQAGAISEDLAMVKWSTVSPDWSVLNRSNVLVWLNSSALAPKRPGSVEALATAYEGPRLLRSELEELLFASLRYSLRRSGLEGASYDRELKLRHQQALEYWELLDIHGLASVGTDLAAVGKALTRGTLVRFDATALLPAAAFNVTAASLAAGEGQHAKRITVLSEPPFFPRSLVSYAKEMAETRLPFGYLQNDHRHLVGFVNLRRLKKFAERLPEVMESLDLGEDVLHSVSILWMGPITAGAWNPAGFSGLHYDHQANVYVQLAGEADAMLIPPAYTDLFDWLFNGLNWPNSVEALRTWLQSSDIPARVPIVLVHLRPGDGLTVPSRTYHYFLGQDTERVALNYFFHPRWRRMQYNATDYTSRTNLTQLALQKLALLSARRVFREKGKVVFTDGGRFELI